MTANTETTEAPDQGPVQRRLRLALLVLVFLLNPVTYSWWHTVGGVFPDSVSYLLLSRQLLETGQLFVAQIGHVDTGLILPPLYPPAIGLVSQIYQDPILVSQWLSAAAMLAASVPLFLWLERATNAWLAAAALAVTQLQPFYLLYGTSTLTESFFVLGTCALGYWAGAIFSRPQPGWTALLALGAGAALLFLVRQIGIFLLPALMVFSIVLRARAGTGPLAPPLSRSLVALTLGFIAIIGPYALAVHAQTGQPPWTQSFRMNAYVVSAPAGLAQPAPVKNAADAPSYAEVYAERRELRQLSEDGREMLGYRVDGSTPADSLLRRMARTELWLQNLGANIAHADKLLGTPLLLMVFLGVLLCLVIPGTSDRAAWRQLLPAMVLSYLLVLSLLTGLVERYVEVLLPVLIAQAAAGTYFLVHTLARGRRLTTLAWAGVAAAAMGGGAAMSDGPLPPTVTLTRKVGEATNPIAPCRTLVTPGEGMFSFHPVEAYLLGATHRIIPNDSLERIAAYGRLTGTRWLLLRLSAATEREVRLYTHAGWLQNLDELSGSADFTPRCGSPVLGAVLFEIAGVGPARPPPPPDPPRK